MREFIDLTLSFPTVVFTISTLFFLGFWAVSMVVGAGMNSLDDFDFDFDSDVDADLDLDVDSDLELDADGNRSTMRSALEFLGLTDMPMLIAINLLSLFSWLASIILMAIIGGADNTVAIWLGVPVMIASFLASGFVTGRLARKFSHVFVPTVAFQRKELVGSACTITTQKVTAEFGQAEVRDDEGGSLIVQVRCLKANELTAGDRALIFDLDANSGVFTISPDKSLAP